ncbi:hypothetical protein EV702DRAFT_1033278 [Suillus placidus]|uniref:Uncharacterized protein n=1 Tax=Suillus placidus TaxID=48579 RepID=A0A9P7CZ40_9AGAM|nr:hypothetical protein EV702DRAFT_1033278 [Suillus placidus]
MSASMLECLSSIAMPLVTLDGTDTSQPILPSNIQLLQNMSTSESLAHVVSRAQLQMHGVKIANINVSRVL